MPHLLDALVKELERPRTLPAQVVKHLGAAYGLGRDELGEFLNHQLPKLEDYEIDLILSPVFTPTLAEQAVFAELLGQESVPATEWAGLVRQLVARPTVARLEIGSDDTRSVPLREVSVERFVNRLRLDGTIPGPLFQLIVHLAPVADRPLLKAVARRAVWEPAPRGQILYRCLLASAGGDAYRLDDILELLKLVETYGPKDAPDLLAHFPHWRQVLRQEINLASNPKPFFTPRIEELHGGGRDQRRKDDSRIAAKQRELEVLDRLAARLSAK